MARRAEPQSRPPTAGCLQRQAPCGSRLYGGTAQPPPRSLLQGGGDGHRTSPPPRYWLQGGHCTDPGPAARGTSHRSPRSGLSPPHAPRPGRPGGAARPGGSYRGASPGEPHRPPHVPARSRAPAPRAARAVPRPRQPPPSMVRRAPPGAQARPGYLCSPPCGRPRGGGRQPALPRPRPGVRRGRRCARPAPSFPPRCRSARPGRAIC